jgi:hypothetical protein
MPADHGTEGDMIKLPPLLVVALRTPLEQQEKKKRRKMTIPDWMKTPKESTDEDRTQN